MEDFKGFLTPEGNTKEYTEELQDSDEEEESDKNVEGSEGKIFLIIFNCHWIIDIFL